MARSNPTLPTISTAESDRKRWFNGMINVRSCETRSIRDRA